MLQPDVTDVAWIATPRYTRPVPRFTDGQRVAEVMQHL